MSLRETNLWWTESSLISPTSPLIIWLVYFISIITISIISIIVVVVSIVDWILFAITFQSAVYLCGLRSSSLSSSWPSPWQCLMVVWSYFPNNAGGWVDQSSGRGLHVQTLLWLIKSPSICRWLSVSEHWHKISNNQHREHWWHWIVTYDLDRVIFCKWPLRTHIHQ